MTYDEAMEAVKLNKAAHPDRKAKGAATLARRAVWAIDPRMSRRGVIYHDTWHGEGWDGSWQPELMLNDFGYFDPEFPDFWGLDVNAIPWWPTEEDLCATDWAIHERWS